MQKGKFTATWGKESVDAVTIHRTTKGYLVTCGSSLPIPVDDLDAAYDHVHDLFEPKPEPKEQHEQE